MRVQGPGRTVTGPRWLTVAEQRAWRSFIDGQQRLLDQLNRELQRDTDLTLAEYRILVLLSESPDHSLRMSDLADGVLSSRSRLTHQIRRMEEAGLVQRTSCAEDGRGVIAQLTDQGMQRLREAAPIHVEGVREHFIDHLDEHQVAVIGDVFARLVDEVGEPGGR